jgi:hypothetical protein
VLVGGRTIAQAVSRWLPPWRPGFDLRSSHVGFVVDRVALGQVSSEYFRFPCQSPFYQLLHNHHHLSSGAGTIGKQWPMYQVDSRQSHPTHRNLKKKPLCNKAVWRVKTTQNSTEGRAGPTGNGRVLKMYMILVNN